MPIHYQDHSSSLSIVEIRVLTSRVFLYGINNIGETERKALKELAILTDELSIMSGRSPAPFTETGLVLAKSITQQFLSEAERTHGSV